MGRLEELVAAHQGGMTITELSLRGEKLGDSAPLLRNFLMSCNSVTKLDLAGAGITAGDMRVVAEGLARNQSVVSLDLQNNSIANDGAAALARVVEKSKSIRLLNLRFNYIGSSGGEVLAKALDANESVRFLILRNNKIGTAGAQALAETLKGSKTLRKVDVHDNHISERGLLDLCKALTTNISIEDLDISANSASDRVIRALSEALLNSKGHAPVHELNLSQMPMMGEKSVEHLTKLVAKSDELKVLQLRYNMLGSANVVSLVNGVVSNKDSALEVFDLRGNEIGPKASEAIGTLVGSPDHHVQRLGLAYNNLGGVGVTHLISLAANGTTQLVALDVRENGMDESCAARLLHAFRSHTSLKEVLVREGSGLIGDSVLESIEAINMERKLKKRKSVADINFVQAIDAKGVLRAGISKLTTNFAAGMKNMASKVSSTVQSAMDQSARMSPRGRRSSLSTVASGTHVDLSSIPLSARVIVGMSQTLGGIVQVLKLEHCYLHAESVAYLAPIMGTVQELRMSHNPRMGAAGGAALAKLFGEARALRLLHVANCQLEDAGMAALLGALSNVEGIEALDLAHNALTRKGVLAVATYLPRAPRLVALNLSKTAIDSEHAANELLTAIKHHPKLEAVDLSTCMMTGNGAGALQQLAQGNRILRDLKLHTNELAQSLSHFATGMRANKTIHELDLSHCKLNDGSVLEWCHLTSGNASLEVLRMGHNAFMDSGLRALCGWVHQHPRLRVLDLSGNALGGQAATIVAYLVEHCQLTAIELSECSLTANDLLVMQKAFATNRTVQDLVLSYNALGVHGGAAAGTLVAQAATLTTLDISACELGDEGVQSFLQVLGTHAQRSSLAKLDLSRNGCHTGGVHAIARVLPSLQSLRTLSLAWNDIYPHCAQVLASGVAQARPLETLQLHHCPLGDEGASVLATALQGNASGVVSLDVCGCSIGDVGITALCNSMRGMHTLLAAHNHIGDAGAHAVAQYVVREPTLRTVDVGFNRFGKGGADMLANAFARSSVLAQHAFASAMLHPDVAAQAAMAMLRAGTRH